MRLKRGFSWPFVGSLLLLLGGCALLAGCQLFSRGKAGKTTTTEKRTLLSPLQPPKDAIQLDLLVIDRRVDDPLIGPMLWNEMDQVGAVPIETQERLAQNGYVVGHAAARPPAALLQLLGMIPQIDGERPSKDGIGPQQVTGRRHFIRAGTEAEIQISDHLAECDVELQDAGRPRSKRFEQARCLFRIKPVRLQDGWIRVEFAPEIHHGQMRMRPRPTEIGWANVGGQDIERCSAQEFAVTLNVGEAAVVTELPGHDGTLGNVFFRRDADGEVRQRLLVVRLVEMGRTAE